MIALINRQPKKVLTAVDQIPTAQVASASWYGYTPVAVAIMVRAVYFRQLLNWRRSVVSWLNLVQ